MNTDKKLLIQNYLVNLQVNVIEAEYTKCWSTWREINYTPSYNKFYFICDGCGWLQIDGHDFYPEPGQFFLMPAGTLQSYSAINNNPFLKYWCHFTATVGERNLFDIIKPPYYFQVKDSFLLESLFKELIEAMKSRDITAPLKVKSSMLQIISYYIENSLDLNSVLSESLTSERIGTVINYINTHLSEHITVESLAGQLHFHPNYFSRFFKSYLGVSPMQYLHRVRMQKAKELLKQTDLPVTVIAEQTGFKDLFYFSNTFKNYSGYSPSEYRNT
jgi:AraC-like DNA-binding protein